MGLVRRYTVVALWTLLIFCTIPLAEWIEEQVPEAAFTWTVVTVFVLAAMGGGIRLKRAGKRSLQQVLVLIGVGGFGCWQAFRLAGSSAAEALHYVEYGVLTPLWIRAGLQVRRDESVFLFAFLATSLTGMLDECLQWLLPDRVFDFRDMGMNVQAALLGLVWVRFGTPAEFELRRFRAAGCRGSMAAWTMICLTITGCLINTPKVAERIPYRLPFLMEWSKEWGEMAEYGYLHAHPEIGEWKSRLTIDELWSEDASHAAGMLLVRDDRDAVSYGDLLQMYPPGREPFLHEYLVHQFRLNRYRFKRNKYKEDDVERYERYCRVAYMEHRILSEVFPSCYEAFDEVLPDFVIEEARQVANLDPDYFSPVSRHLITKVTQGQAIGILCGCWALGMLGLLRLLRS